MINGKVSTLVFKGLSWSFASRSIGNLAQLIVFFVLAKYLEPADFGIMALLAVFINICNIFVTAGLGNANMQIQNLGKNRYSTIFYLGLALSILFYSIIYVTAPYLSVWLGNDAELVSLLRIYGLTIFFTVINTMQISELSRNFEFEKIFYCSTLPSIVSGVVSVCLAYSGFGIYALIVNVALSRLLSILFYSYYYSPFPRLKINFTIVKKSTLYSSNLFFVNLLDEAYKSSILLLIGKFYNNTILGHYNLGRQIPGFVSATINATVTSVFFPVFSGLQNDLAKGKEMLRKSNRTLNFLIFPLLCLVILLADEIVSIFLTDKWLPSVIYLKLFAIILGLHHVYNTSSTYINALGYSSVTLKYGIFNKFIGFVVLALTLNEGVEAIVYGQLFVVILSILFYAIPNRKYIKYSFKEQAVDFFPILIVNIFLYVIFSEINFYFSDTVTNFFFEIFAFLLMYIVIVVAFRLRVVSDLINIFKRNTSVKLK